MLELVEEVDREVELLVEEVDRDVLDEVEEVDLEVEVDVEEVEVVPPLPDSKSGFMSVYPPPIQA